MREGPLSELKNIAEAVDLSVALADVSTYITDPDCLDIASAC